MVTNAHVVEGCSTVTVVSERTGTSLAEVVARDTTNDLALIKVKSKPQSVASIRMGVRVGEPVAAFGFPLSGLLATSGNFTFGNVTALSGIADDTRSSRFKRPFSPAIPAVPCWITMETL